MWQHTNTNTQTVSCEVCLLWRWHCSGSAHDCDSPNNLPACRPSLPTQRQRQGGWMDGVKERMAELLIGLKIKKNPRTPPLHFLPVCSSSQPCSLLSKSGLLSNYCSFLSTPSLLGADVSAQGPFIREEERSVGEKSCARECVRGEPTERQQAPARGLRWCPPHILAYVNFRLSPGHPLPWGCGGDKAPVDWPFFFLPFPVHSSGGSLAASPSQFAGKHGASPSPRGAGRGLQSNVVTRQPGARGRQKSGGSRKRPVLVEDRLLGLDSQGE